MNVGFISTRLAGTDGVSLETAKMADVLRRHGHHIFYCAGELDGDVPGLLAPELHFKDPVAQALGKRAFGVSQPDPHLRADIAARARQLQQPLRRFLAQYAIEYVIIQNALAIPMQLPLAQALADVLQETQVPALAHNHDLYWERERFRHSQIEEFLEA